ncbi:MAG TPA: TonB-dependent receptor [Pseudacidobacterium sp.]|jgi:TonB-dependent receptor|nr:TonB-dependent receptor [Pseudacidobacterium sp.]
MRYLARRLFVVLLFSTTLFLSRLPAQTGSGAIAGTVQDSVGSVFVSAKVEIEPSGRQAATDNQGQFRISNIPAGTYTLTTSYVGFNSYATTVNVVAGQTANVTAVLQVGSQADTVMVTAGRLQGDAEAINVERMSANIVQVLPQGLITSLPNTNIADAIGRAPSVSLERDEGEGKYVQIRGTEPRLSSLTINGVNVPSVEVTVRNVKMDAIPSNGIERIEVYKTLSADQDADGVGGTVNLVTPTAQDKPTYSLNGTTGYNPIQNGFWRGGFDGTFGQRFGANKRFGFLLGGTWDRTNRGIDDMEPSQTFGFTQSGQAAAFVNTKDLRSYKYYRTRYGFTTGIDYKVTPTMTAYVKGLYADFHDYGDTWVYTPTPTIYISPVDGSNQIKSVNGSTVTFYTPSECNNINNQYLQQNPNGTAPCTPGSWAYRHYIRRPDQQVFSFLVGGRHDLPSDVIDYEFAVSRGHNIGGQDFSTTYFSGPSSVDFTQSLSNPYRPTLTALDGTNGFDPTLYTVNASNTGQYHATQLNFQGGASISHSYTVYGHPSTFSTGLKIRNSYSTQRENDTSLSFTGSNPFTLASVVGGFTNPTYYNRTFAINGLAFGPASSYTQIQNAVAANSSAFTEDIPGDWASGAAAFFNADERITAGYLQDVIYFGNFRLQGGVRFDYGTTHFLANTTDTTQQIPCPKDPTQQCLAVTPTRQSADYFNALPSVALQYQLQKDTNLRVVYSRGLARPNIGDLVPATTVDPNQTPYPTVSTGNPSLVPTLSDNIDVLAEHYFQPLGILQAGFFFKELHNPIYPVATLLNNYNNTGRTYQLTQSINGPNAHIQGFEAQWEQRFSFLPGFLNGFGVNANYSYTGSQVTFPEGFDGGRTDHPRLDRTSPNDYNFNLTYDKNRFSGRFAISHNDASIAAYQWNAGTGPANDPILGLRGPTGDNYFYPHTQFDAQGQYRVYKGLQAVFSVLNMSNEVFGFYNGSGIYPVQREYYRPTYSFGVRWALTPEQ